MYTHCPFFEKYAIEQLSFPPFRVSEIIPAVIDSEVNGELM